MSVRHKEFKVDGFSFENPSLIVASIVFIGNVGNKIFLISVLERQTPGLHGHPPRKWLLIINSAKANIHENHDQTACIKKTSKRETWIHFPSKGCLWVKVSTGKGMLSISPSLSNEKLLKSKQIDWDSVILSTQLLIGGLKAIGKNESKYGQFSSSTLSDQS